MDKAKIMKLCQQIGLVAMSDKKHYPALHSDFDFINDSQMDIFREVTASPKTNADRIRQMTDEELAAFIDIYDIEDICKTRCAKTGEARERCMCYGEECKSHILKWLKQEVSKNGQ